jgi:WD40 repeat protein
MDKFIYLGLLIKLIIALNNNRLIVLGQTQNDTTTKQQRPSYVSNCITFGSSCTYSLYKCVELARCTGIECQRCLAMEKNCQTSCFQDLVYPVEVEVGGVKYMRCFPQAVELSANACAFNCRLRNVEYKYGKCMLEENTAVCKCSNETFPEILDPASTTKITTHSPVILTNPAFILSDGHRSAVNSLAVMPYGELVSGSAYGSIKVWAVSSDYLMRSLHYDYFETKALLPLPNSNLVSASLNKKNNNIYVWDIYTGAIKQTLSGHIDGTYSLALLKNGQLASGGGDSLIKIWDLKTGNLTKTIKIYGAQGNVVALVAMENGRLISAVDQGVILEYDVETGTLISVHYANVNSMVALNSTHVATGNQDKSITIFNIPQRKLTLTIENAHDSSINVVALLKNGDLASGSNDYARTVKIWNVNSGALKKTLNVDGFVYSMAVLWNGQLVCGADKDIFVWDV